MAVVVVDGTTQAVASEMNKFVSAVDNELGIAIAATQIAGTATTPTCASTCGFDGTVTKNATGDYSITLSTAFSATPWYFATAFPPSGTAFCYLEGEAEDSVRVQCVTDAGEAVDCAVNVIAVGIRSN